MTDGGFEIEDAPTPGAALTVGLLNISESVGQSLPDLCSYGLTVGESYVPFDPDEEDEDCGHDEGGCSQAWVRVMGINDRPLSADGGDGWGDGDLDGWGDDDDDKDDEDCKCGFVVDFEVGAIRCFPAADGGAAPTATEVLLAASQTMDDMSMIRCAVMNTKWDGASLEVGQWVPMGPAGMMYGGVWTFTVTIA